MHVGNICNRQFPHLGAAKEAIDREIKLPFGEAALVDRLDGHD
jgi:hypothetical protein